MRDFAQIEAAARLMQDYQTKSEVLNMPPGYIVGFNITLNNLYAVTISSGTANVQGLAVQLAADHRLTGDDWVVQRIDTPNHYYIYLSKDGSVKVDLVRPLWNDQWAYYEQPDTGWRAVGRIFVKSTDIVFASPVLFSGGR